MEQHHLSVTMGICIKPMPTFYPQILTIDKAYYEVKEWTQTNLPKTPWPCNGRSGEPAGVLPDDPAGILPDAEALMLQETL